MNHSKADTATDNFRHHPRFFMEPLFVQINDTLFQIPRVAFEGRKGSPFANAASLPAQQSTDPFAKSMVEGRSADKPVILPVEVADFENLLHVMYASGLLIPDYPTHISKEEWTSALRLVTLWNFDDIRDKAIKALDSSFSNPMERLCVAREFRIRGWLVSSYEGLITGPISALQPSLCSTTLGWETLALIHHARNEYGTGPSYNPASLVQHLNSGISSVGYQCFSCNANHIFGGGNYVSPFALNKFRKDIYIARIASWFTMLPPLPPNGWHLNGQGSERERRRTRSIRSLHSAIREYDDGWSCKRFKKWPNRVTSSTTSPSCNNVL